MKILPSHLLLVLAPFLLANCRSTKTAGTGGGSDTPGHNMSRSEYPFDENGNYREDWVKGTDNGSKVVDLTKDNPPSPFLGTTDARDTRPTKTTAGSNNKTKSTSGSSKKVASSKTKSIQKKPVAKSTVVTIKKGDTLYGLAKRYGTSVKSIQSANGMGSSTALRDGKSLKIPR